MTRRKATPAPADTFAASVTAAVSRMLARGASSRAAAVAAVAAAVGVSTQTIVRWMAGFDPVPALRTLATEKLRTLMETTP